MICIGIKPETTHKIMTSSINLVRLEARKSNYKTNDHDGDKWRTSSKSPRHLKAAMGTTLITKTHGFGIVNLWSTFRQSLSVNS